MRVQWAWTGMLWTGTLLCVAATTGGCGVGGELETVDREQLPIIGGQPSKASFVPAAGALIAYTRMGWRAFCTGSLISPTAVLTAAHCVAKLPVGAQLAFFVGDDVSRLQSGGAIRIASTRPHPGYVDSSQPPGALADYYDVAIAHLASSAPSTVKPLKMIRPSEAGGSLTRGHPVMLIGYGKTSSGTNATTGVKYQGLSNIAQVGRSELWVYTNTGAQKCNGDSGGPTLADLDSSSAYDWRVIGVASRAGQDCTGGSVETRVDAYLKWIHAQVNDVPCGSGLNKDCAPPPPKAPPKAKSPLGGSCSVASDCADDLCVIDGGERVCARSCDPKKSDSCPTGYACVSINGDSKGGCVQRKPPEPKPASDTTSGQTNSAPNPALSHRTGGCALASSDAAGSSPTAPILGLLLVGWALLRRRG